MSRAILVIAPTPHKKGNISYGIAFSILDFKCFYHPLAFIRGLTLQETGGNFEVYFLVGWFYLWEWSQRRKWSVLLINGF